MSRIPPGISSNAFRPPTGRGLRRRGVVRPAVVQVVLVGRESVSYSGEMFRTDSDGTVWAMLYGEWVPVGEYRAWQARTMESAAAPSPEMPSDGG
jgi:hypothetical protein